VLHELVGDKSLERFCVEYEKVFQAVRKSHGRPSPCILHLKNTFPTKKSGLGKPGYLTFTVF
jgi:hypothetical protein